MSAEPASADPVRAESARAESRSADPASAESRPLSRLAGQRGLVGLVALLFAIWSFGGFSWVVIVLVLVATLVLHELGHYVAARATGMKVTEFFVGFGPRVWSFRRGETEYGIKALWAGAYVRIVGMNNLERVEPADENRSFRSKSYPRKLLVLVAGSATHFALAAALLFAVLVADGPVSADDNLAETREWTLASVSADSAASAAGLEPGDELVSVAGAALRTFADFSAQISQLAGQQVEVVYRRDGELRTAVTRVGERLTEAGAAGITGLIEGDRILAVEGLESDGPPTYAQVSRHLSDRLGEPVDIAILDTRTGAPTIVEGAVANRTLGPSDAVRGFFGVSPDYRRVPMGVVEAVPESLRLLASIVREVVVAMPMVVTEGLFGTFDGLLGDEPAASGPDTARDPQVRRVAGPGPAENRVLSIYGVARIGAEVASSGTAAVLILLVLVNVFLGVFNLVPLLPLDGGHVAVATYERLRSVGGRSHEVDAAKLMPLTYAVVALLLLIGGVALVRDIMDPVSLG